MSRYHDHYWGAGPILRDSAAMTLDDIRDVLGEIAGPDPDEPRQLPLPLEAKDLDRARGPGRVRRRRKSVRWGAT